MKKELWRSISILLLLLILLLLVGCKEKISDEEIDAELEDLSDEELDLVITETEGENAIAGQAYNFRIISAPSEQIYIRATLLKKNRQQNKITDVVKIAEQDKMPVVGLTSDFFKENIIAKKINENGEPYNLAEENLILNGELNKDSFSYKVASGLIMLGYSPNRDGTNTKHLVLLHKFQKNNGLPESDFLTKPALVKMDHFLKVREAELNPYASQFPLFSHLSELHQNSVSKDYVAMLYVTANSALPSKLQLAGEKEFFYCIDSQCVGFIHPFNAPPGYYDNIDPNSNYLLSSFHNNLMPGSWLSGANINIQTIIHEYAHFLEGIKNKDFPELYEFKTKMDTVDARLFAAISYQIDPSDSGCFYRKGTIKDFISRYGYSSKLKDCEDNGIYNYDYKEDFAESFSVYVAAGKRFREAAKTNVRLAQKYNWLKNNVFDGIEYNTDMSFEGSSGCYDNTDKDMREPGYLSCNEDYVWNVTWALLN